MSFNVFLVASLGAPRDHHALFVESTDQNGSGVIYQVKGNIQNGMIYEVKSNGRPEESTEFVSKSYLGWVDVSKYNRIDEICRGIPPPTKQFEGNKRLNPGAPLRRCQEWTQDAILALEADGVLQTESQRQ